VAAFDTGAAAGQRSGCTLTASADADGDAATEPNNKSTATTVTAGNEDTKILLNVDAFGPIPRGTSGKGFHGINVTGTNAL
jgi:hypothetical protein